MRHLVVTSLFFLFALTSKAQHSQEFGGGNMDYEAYPGCQSAVDDALANAIHLSNVDSLTQAGILSAPIESTVSLRWPLRMSTSLDWNDIGSITNFIDHDPTTSLLIYNCNTARTYDGHNGIDIPTWPFPWYLANNNYAEVIASADGVITYRVDGQDDDHCQWGLPGTWNAIFIQHCDGSSTRYGHMKKFSLTSKMVGDSVSKGEFLGIVASSGTSTGPHIHFEVRDAANNVLDPNPGTCNNTVSSTLWDVQRPFRAPQLNVNLTHDAVPEHGCPSSNENPHMANYIAPGDSVWLATYFQDQTIGDTTFIRILEPNQSVWQTMQHVAPNTYNKSWWYWRRLLPPAGPYGMWTFEVTYRGNVRKHEFQFGSFPTSTIDRDVELQSLKVFPNPMTSLTKVEFVHPRSEFLELELYNILGEHLQTLHSSVVEANKRYSYSIGDLKGLYFLVLRNREEVLERLKVVSK